MEHSVFMNLIPERTPLARVFWVYGVIPSNLLWGVTLYLIAVGADMAAVSLMFLVLLMYTAWVVLAIWNTADNTQKPLYGVMARWLTVAWSLNTILMVGFLQLDLLA